MQEGTRVRADLFPCFPKGLFPGAQVKDMERGPFFDMSLSAMRRQRKERDMNEGERDMNEGVSSNTQPVQTDGSSKSAFSHNSVKSLAALTIRQWMRRRWNAICLFISFLCRVFIGIVAFGLISVSGVMFLRWVDDMDIASRASNVLAPFATTMPWLVVGVLVLVVSWPCWSSDRCCMLGSSNRRSLLYSEHRLQQGRTLRFHPDPRRQIQVLISVSAQSRHRHKRALRPKGRVFWERCRCRDCTGQEFRTCI